MRLWNGWGDHNEYKDVKLNSSLSALLSGLLGPGKPLPIASIEDVIAKIPKIFGEDFGGVRRIATPNMIF